MEAMKNANRKDQKYEMCFNVSMRLYAVEGRRFLKFIQMEW